MRLEMQSIDFSKKELEREQDKDYNYMNQMLNLTFEKVINDDDQNLIFISNDYVFIFYHSQDCCETVSIEDIVGDLDDLIDTPILLSEEVSNADGEDLDEESFTWTFYKWSTIKGSVTVRWLGTSNGYYSESVSCRIIDRNIFDEYTKNHDWNLR